MSYTINYLKDKKIVQVKIQGRVNFRVAQQYSIGAIKLAHEYNCKKFLFNHTKTLLETGIYKIHTDGDGLEQFGFKSSDKIAIVILSDLNDNHFFEETDSNVKWSNFKYFNTIELETHYGQYYRYSRSISRYVTNYRLIFSAKKSILVTKFNLIKIHGENYGSTYRTISIYYYCSSSILNVVSLLHPNPVVHRCDLIGCEDKNI